MIKKARFADFLGVTNWIILFATIFFIGFLFWYGVNFRTYDNPENNSDQWSLPPINNSNGTGLNNNSSVNESYILELISRFNLDDIDSFLNIIGIDKLHKSIIQENPFIEFYIDREYWNVEIIDGEPLIKNGSINNPDILITTSKEEILRIINSGNKQEDLKNGLFSGKISIQMIAGQVELAEKGYVDLYNSLIGVNNNIGLNTQSFWSRVLESLDKFFEARKY